MTPPHLAGPLELTAETVSSEALDSSECAAACKPLKALEQGEVVVVATIRGRGERECVGGKSYCYGYTRVHLTVEM